MAEELDDGEFWLPSHFLTDDDILSDFKHSTSHSDLDFSSSTTETDTDDDDFLSFYSKGLVLSTSPQSTLCGFVGKDESTRSSSPNQTVTPPPTAEEDGGETLDLLSKAAGEVARIKLNHEKTSGTGFFDCSNPTTNNMKRLFCPPPPPKPPITSLPFYTLPQFPPLSQLQQMRRQQEEQGKRLLGLGPCAWPPSRAQNHVIPPVYVEPKRESVGTGVFLPRHVNHPTPAPDSRKKPEGNPMRMRSGKGSQSQRKRNSRPSMGNPTEIQLPEWTY